MSEPNIDALAEQRYADSDPTMTIQKMRDFVELSENYITDLDDILLDIQHARELIRMAKDAYQTRRFNETDRLLSEAEDKIDELLERGL